MTSKQYAMFPVQHQALWALYKKATAHYWIAEEVDLTKDNAGWEALSADERHFIKNVLAFFAGSDGIVNENLVTRFYKDVELPEARAFYSFQMAIESVHSETYALLLQQYVRDDRERAALFDAVNGIPCVRRKAEWALKWELCEGPLNQRLVAFACVEGIHFSGSFCAIFWLKYRGIKLPGLCYSNELISRDEAMHTDFAVALYNILPDRLEQATVHSIIREAVEAEKEFIIDSLPVSLLGMNSDMMCRYIEYVADRLALQLGYDRVFGVLECPFAWMELISLERKGNFFEDRVSEYMLASTGGSASKKNDIDVDADF